MISAVAATSANIARHLGLRAAEAPDRAALKVPRGRTRAGDIDYLSLSFAELEAEVAAWVSRLAGAGVRPGDRTLILVRPGLPLIAGVFALFHLGAVPVVVDPGLGRANLLAAVAHTRPRALVAVPLGLLLSYVCRSAFRGVRVRVPASSSLTARLASPGAGAPRDGLPVAANSSTDLAAILFTSGSTGAPKGVCYTHGHFEAQVRLVRDAYGIEPGEVDLPLLPVFALFNPALGMTTVVPELDPRRPATIDAAATVRAIRQERVTNSFGSPTLWRRVADHCLAHDIRLPSLRRVLCAGAPVPASLWVDAPRFLPLGRLHSPYGATEALPVASIAHDAFTALGDITGRGAPVGRPLVGNRVKIIAQQDGPIASLADARELPAGGVGEIIVSGPSVTAAYDGLPEATAKAKIADNRDVGGGETAATPAPGAPPGPALWHRMGDAGYLDAEGRLWFCGRVVERVQTAAGPLYTEPFEQVFRTHPAVARCALVGLGPPGGQEPALVVERRGRAAGASAASGEAVAPALDDATLARELLALASRHAHTRGLRRIYFHPSFPVDVRHNAKIHRLTLARWAATARPALVAPEPGSPSTS